MKYGSVCLFGICLLYVGALAQYEGVTAYLVDQATGAPVSGAIVVGKSTGAPMAATSNSEGFVDVANGLDKVSKYSPSVSPTFAGGVLHVQTVSSQQLVSIQLFDLKGRLLSDRSVRFMEPGGHEMPLASKEMGGSIGILLVRVGDEVHRMKVSPFDMDPSPVRRTAGITNPPELRRAAADPVWHFSAPGYETQTVWASSENSLGEIKLRKVSSFMSHLVPAGYVPRPYGATLRRF
jgi:hypothetical protein